MSIEPVRSDKGQPRANCICDKCAREEVIPCNHERRRGLPDAVNQGQVIKKLTQGGWSFVKNKLRCPMCEAKRKSYEAEKSKHVIPQRFENGIPENWHNFRGNPPMSKQETTDKTNDIRQPTPEQEVDIIVTLSSAYDRKAKRYQGSETDKTVAETIGGVMPGWVAAIREAKFGPAGGNEEIEKIRAEIAALNTECAAKIALLNKRIDAVCAAVGPRARSA
jgi:rubredoxin